MSMALLDLNSLHAAHPQREAMARVLEENERAATGAPAPGADLAELLEAVDVLGATVLELRALVLEQRRTLEAVHAFTLELSELRSKAKGAGPLGMLKLLGGG